MSTGAERLPSFKAYDVRGVVPDELNEDLAYRIGRAYADVVRPQKVAVGRDVRPSSEALAAALARGLNDGGADVLDIGLCGTEEVYFATFHLGLDGGIMVTASHNPAEYNGMKFVRERAIPISGESGLLAIEELARTQRFSPVTAKGTTRTHDIKEAYIDHLLGYVDPQELRPFTIACNPGNGCAGPVLRRIAERIPCRLVMRYEEPDGTFPNGVPNPLLPENRS
ncbi:MAG TPA: phosphomannomutase, partial [Limnochordia bacterium]|nr:phosphomannomutase [Limnochordia bacterium]